MLVRGIYKESTGKKVKNVLLPALTILAMHVCAWALKVGELFMAC